MIFSAELMARAEALLAQARAKGLKIATAESCTGGLLAGLLTEIPGSSDVFERGFVTYSNAAKCDQLGVPDDVIREFGSVSELVAREMAHGALLHSKAQLSVAVTGIAGPSGGVPGKPVGLVHLAAARGDHLIHRHCHFGDIGRTEVRLKSVGAAIDLLLQLL
jgi:nicotinamide-nucleotide amidase